MSSLGSRITEIRNKLVISQASFANLVGVAGASTINNWEKDTREPEIKFLVKISELGNVTLDWLLTGIKKENDAKNKEKKKSVDLINVRYNIEAIVPAGIAEMKEMQSENTEDLYFDPRYHFYLKIDEENGFSMKPVIQPGDLVLVSLNAKVRDNDLVAARWEDGRKGAVKIYKERGNQVVLLSYNQTVDPIFLEKNKVHAYRVMLIRKMK